MKISLAERISVISNALIAFSVLAIIGTGAASLQCVMIVCVAVLLMAIYHYSVLLLARNRTLFATSIQTLDFTDSLYFSVTWSMFAFFRWLMLVVAIAVPDVLLQEFENSDVFRALAVLVSTLCGLVCILIHGLKLVLQIPLQDRSSI